MHSLIKWFVSAYLYYSVAMPHSECSSTKRILPLNKAAFLRKSITAGISKKGLIGCGYRSVAEYSTISVICSGTS